MAHSFLFQKLCQKETRKLVMVMGMLAAVVILFWPFMILSGNAFSSLYPAVKAAVFAKGSFTTEGSSPKSTRFNNLPYSSNLTNSTDPSTVLRDLQTTEVSKTGVQFVHDNKTWDGGMEDDFELDEETDEHVELDDKKTDNELSDGEVVNGSDKSAVEQVLPPDSTVENTRKHEFSPHKTEKPDDKFALDAVGRSDSFSIATNGTSPDNDRGYPPVMLPTLPAVESGVPGRLDVSASPPSMLPTLPAVESGVPGWLNVSTRSPAMLPTLPAVESGVPGRLGVTSGESPVSIVSNVSVTSKQAPAMLDSHEKFGLLQHGSATSSNSSTISTFPIVKRGRQQITISQMNNILLQNRASHSVKPHWSSASDKELLSLKRQVENAPIVRTDQELDGLVFRNISISYALMERRLKAPKITRGSMEQSIGALCNADVSRVFKLGKDVSLPVTNVRSGDPLRDLGGKPASQRTTLAFYAGNVHGRLREILMKYWGNKDPDMKIMGPIPTGVDNRKMIYIQHMKNSKYCICPRGYEVHSPRVVEAIFYECVPVIVSDNYVPPFFEILNWETFAIFVAEKDVPKLKDILLSIPQERYLIMQERVRKVQQHFLWHKKAVKDTLVARNFVTSVDDGEKLTPSKLRRDADEKNHGIELTVA
ncbi:hypothetical protein ACLOJK_021155 [Asimina triloba]